MARYGAALTITYVAWDTSANAGKTGDVSNHTLRWVKDGVSAAPTNSPSEVDATNAPGVYKITLTAAEATCSVGVLAGKSATANVSIVPIAITFDYNPAVDTVDGVTYESAIKALMAVLFNKAAPSGSQVAFKNRAGDTTVITITYGSSAGERTASEIA